jgi:hypothetical protein
MEEERSLSSIARDFDRDREEEADEEGNEEEAEESSEVEEVTAVAEVPRSLRVKGSDKRTQFFDDG